MAEALSALVQGQALLSAQGAQAKALVLMSACCRSESCCPEEDLLGIWQIQGRQQPCEAHSQPGAHGSQLMPDLAAVEAIAERLIFQSSSDEQVQVKTALGATDASLTYSQDCRHTTDRSPLELILGGLTALPQSLSMSDIHVSLKLRASCRQ